MVFVKSVKKRFKSVLADVEQAASELRMLSAQLVLLEDVQQMADRVLHVCAVLRVRVASLHKVDFAEQMATDQNLVELDEVVDADLISLLEERLSSACSVGQAEGQLSEFVGQLLDKLEKCHAAMIENIQRLTALIGQAG